MQHLQHGEGHVVHDDSVTASAKPVYVNNSIGFGDDEEEADTGSDSTSSEEENGKNKIRQLETVDFEPPDCVEFPADQVPAYRELPYQRFVQPNSMGAGQPIYANLDALSMEDGAHRLIHVDFSRRKGGVPPFLLLSSTPQRRT